MKILEMPPPKDTVEQATRREHVAQMLESIAKDVRARPDAANAIFVTIFYGDNEVNQHSRMQAGVNLFPIIGFFEGLKSEIVDVVKTYRVPHPPQGPPAV